MLYSIKNRDDLEKLSELVLLQNQLEELRLPDELGKQNFHEVMKKSFEPVTKPIKSAYEDVTKINLVISTGNIEAIVGMNNGISNIKIDRGKLASYLLMFFI